MRCTVFTSEQYEQYPLVILAPAIKKDEMLRAYLTPHGVSPENVIAFQTHQSAVKKKTPKAEMVAWVTEELLPELERTQPSYVLVADAEYFKLLADTPKVDANLGYVLDSKYGPWKVVYIPNYRALFYDPAVVGAKIQRAMQAVQAHAESGYSAPGSNIITYQDYPRSVEDIKAWLDKLLAMDCPLAIDIEAFSLKPYLAGIGTISFAWNKEEGIAFAVDYEEIPDATEAPYGRQGYNAEVRKLLKDFFNAYRQTQHYHNISYDVSVLIYQLFMDDITDTAGLLEGMEVMLSNWEDTKLITYLATNSCAGNKLSLKEQAQEYAGNYAEAEIKDICMIPLDRLLRYNLIDSLSTWFVKEKHWDTMVADEQLDVYQTVFKPAIQDIVQMQLTGLPLNRERVLEVKEILGQDEKVALDAIRSSNVVRQFTYVLKEKWVAEKNAKLKKKRVTLADADVEYNPNSGPQLQALLFDMLGLPVLSLTDSKQPSTDRDTLKALRNHTSDPDVLAFLNGMLDYGAVNKILTSFIPAMLAAPQGKDGWHYLMGFFNLGGTVSGRLSSSEPNLQNLPASRSKYAKIFKSCFQAPPGWLFCGLDFALIKWRPTAAMQ